MARSQCRFDHPPLLRDAAPLPLCSHRGIFVSRNDCSLLGSVYLHPKWTPIRRVHFARMTLIYKDVETVTTGRLQVYGSWPQTGLEEISSKADFRTVSRNSRLSGPARHEF